MPTLQQILNLFDKTFTSTTLIKKEDIKRIITSVYKAEIPKIIVLNKENFETLVSGGFVYIQGVEIALQDIGYELMIKIISDLYNDNL